MKILTYFAFLIPWTIFCFQKIFNSEKGGFSNLSFRFPLFLLLGSIIWNITTGKSLISILDTQFIALFDKFYRLDYCQFFSVKIREHLIGSSVSNAIFGFPIAKSIKNLISVFDRYTAIAIWKAETSLKNFRNSGF